MRSAYGVETVITSPTRWALRRRSNRWRRCCGARSSTSRACTASWTACRTWVSSLSRCDSCPTAETRATLSLEPGEPVADELGAKDQEQDGHDRRVVVGHPRPELVEQVLRPL